MGYGARNWADTSIRYDQKNNILERYLHDMKEAGDADLWLVSCNVEASACAVEAVGADWTTPISPDLGYGDAFMNHLLSPKNEKKIPRSSGAFPNEWIENLAYVIPKFSNAETKVRYVENMKTYVAKMQYALRLNAALVLSYKTDYGSGHYITVVRYDEQTDKFLCYDSWDKNKHCKNGGVLEEYSPSFFTERARPRFMEVWKD